MSADKRSHLRVLWIVPPVLVGILFMVFMTSGKQPPAKSERGEPVRAVRTLTISSLDILPTVEGYGTVQPARVWTAVAQVSGRIIEMHSQLRNGEIFAADTLLYRIDPVDYQLKLAQTQAELVELDVQEQNARALLAIEQRRYNVARRETQRVTKLVDKGSVSLSDLDTVERTMLQARTATQNQKNTLALMPTKRSLLESRVSQAERDLSNTEVKSPFNLRVTGQGIEVGQYVSKGQTLFKGDWLDRVEVTAQVALSSLRHLLLDRPDISSDFAQFKQGLADFTGFHPSLHLDMGSYTATWDAQFVRFSDSVDLETRTIGVVVAVDHPMRLVRPGLRPPLTRGMFVKVLIAGHVQPDRIVLPRTAIHEGKAYLVDAQQRLQIKPVQVLFNQGWLSVLAEGQGGGLQAGQQIVVSDMVPAVSGMLLHTSEDTQLQAAIEAAAKGEQ